MKEPWGCGTRWTGQCVGGGHRGEDHEDLRCLQGPAVRPTRHGRCPCGEEAHERQLHGDARRTHGFVEGAPAAVIRTGGVV